MPSSSKKQHNFMEAIAHSPSFAKKVGVSQSVGQDFSAADKGRKFAKGGDMATKGMNLFKGKESYGEELKEAKAIKSGKISPMQYAKGEKSEKKMAMGGLTGKPAVDPRMAAMLIAKLRGAGGGGSPAPGMKNGGAVKKMATGGMFRSSANGIAQRGKTKATQPKMAGGGKC
jgi:hypothetical protein